MTKLRRWWQYLRHSQECNNGHWVAAHIFSSGSRWLRVLFAHAGLGPVEVGSAFHNPLSLCIFNDRLIPKEMPLYLYKSITIHKGQEMTAVQGQQFNACLAYLPTGRKRNTPGLELVACSRAKGSWGIWGHWGLWYCTSRYHSYHWFKYFLKII